MKKVLITGIGGQDGSLLADFLLKKGYEVHGLIRRTSHPNTQNIRHLLYNPEINNKKFFLHDGDLSDAGSLYRIVQEVQPDEIYNFAAMAGVTPSFKQPEYTLEVGLQGVIRLLEVIKNIKKDTKFFQATSSHIFGNTKESPQTEKTVKEPVSPYGIAKAAASDFLKLYREEYGVFACSAIFYAHISPRYSQSFLLSKIIHSVWRILKGEQKVIEVGYLDNPTDVGYAKEYVEAAFNIMQQEKPDDFIICTGETHTAREFIDIVFQEAGLDKEEYVKEKKEYFRPEVSLLIGDFSKANKTFGYKPKIKYRDLIKIMINGNI